MTGQQLTVEYNILSGTKRSSKMNVNYRKLIIIKWMDEITDHSGEKDEQMIQ